MSNQIKVLWICIVLLFVDSLYFNWRIKRNKTAILRHLSLSKKMSGFLSDMDKDINYIMDRPDKTGDIRTAIIELGQRLLDIEKRQNETIDSLNSWAVHYKEHSH